MYYVGPFVKCQTETEFLIVKRSICSNESCKSQYKYPTNFCNNCGSKVIEENFKSDVPVAKISRHDIENLIDEKLSEISLFAQSEVKYHQHIWVANIDFLDRTICLDDEKVDLEFIDGQINEEIDAFKTTFAKEIQILAEKYLKIEFVWGILKF